MLPLKNSRPRCFHRGLLPTGNPQSETLAFLLKFHGIAATGLRILLPHMVDEAVITIAIGYRLSKLKTNNSVSVLTTETLELK